MRTFAIVNQKGGCGKTTTAINLSAVFARRGLRTLLVDMDQQSHCAIGLGVPEKSIDRTVGDALLRAHAPDFDPSDYAWEVSRNLDLLPSTMRLAALEAAGGGLYQLPDRDRRLALLLSRLRARYDRCVVDCSPTIGLLTFNALRAVREAIIPVETGFFSLRGADKQWRTIRQLVERIGRPIACHLVPTLFDADSSLSREILSTLQHEYAGPLVPVVIHEDEVVREATSFGQPITEYAPDSRACRDFEDLADWLEDHAPTAPATEIQVIVGQGAPPQREPGEHGPAAPPPPEGPVPAGPAPPPRGRAAEVARLVRDMHARGGLDAADLESAGAARPASPGPGAAPHRGEGAAGPAVGLLAPAFEARGAGERPVVEALASRLSAAERARRYFGAHPTPRGVRFMQPGEPGSSICVAGDFNQWSASATPLRYDPKVGAHMAFVEIPPGQYRYRLVIDGKWRADPYNAQRRLNQYQEPASLLVVPHGEGRADP